LVASVDGDGDRLVLTTAKSGTIGSADLAGALISKGVVKRLITTVVAPRWIREQAQTAGVTVTVTDVGFRNVLDGWIGAGSRPALGLEPNGALVIVGKPDDYFERDSLEALAMILGEFRSVVELDEALAAVRDRHPLRQRQMTVQRNVREVIRKVDRALAREPRANWIRSRMGNFVRWEDGRQSCVVVRESGTEPVTRLYFELCDEEARQLVASLEP
jgi:phosphomannomutase